MTTDVQDTQAAAAAAKAAVDRAEADIASGVGGGVSVDRLHRLRDKWRHSTLSAEGARKKAERERAETRLAGLEEVGAQVDHLAAAGYTGPIAEALQDVAAAAARARSLAEAYDASVAELVAAAKDLGAEPVAPSGPRPSSAYVATSRDTVSHKLVTVAPVGPLVQTALGHALAGDVDAAVAEVRAAVRSARPWRPDHLLRATNGTLHAMTAPLSEATRANIASGELTELPDHDIDRYMAGELA